MPTLSILIPKWVIEFKQRIQSADPMILFFLFQSVDAPDDTRYAANPLPVPVLHFFAEHSDLHAHAHTLAYPLPVDTDFDFAPAVLLAKTECDGGLGG